MGESLEVHTPVHVFQEGHVAHCDTQLLKEYVAVQTVHSVPVIVWVENILESLNNSVTDTKTTLSKCFTDYTNSSAQLYWSIILLFCRTVSAINVFPCSHAQQQVSMTSSHSW